MNSETPEWSRRFNDIRLKLEHAISRIPDLASAAETAQGETTKKHTARLLRRMRELKDAMDDLRRAEREDNKEP